MQNMKTEESIDIRIYSGAEGDVPVMDNRIARLLAAVDKCGSLKWAAKEAKISYNAAWMMVRRAEEALGYTLIESGRGRGSWLTPQARAILIGYKRMRRNVARKSETLFKLS